MSNFSNYALAKPYYLRLKKVVDIIIAILIFVLFPLFIILKGFSILKESWNVISGKKTWIGYSLQVNNLPILPKAVYSNINHLKSNSKLFNVDALQKIDEVYASNYFWVHDVKLIFLNIFSLNK